MNFFQNLQLREKVFVMGAVVAVLLALLFALVVDPMLKHSAQLDRLIRKAQSDLEELRVQRVEYLRHKSVLDSAKQQLTRQQNFAIFSRMAQLARETGIRDKIEHIRPTVSTPSEMYEEESVEVKIEGVTLEQLIQYLYRIEHSPQLLKIKRLSLKPRRNNRQLLTAIFRVSIFTPKDETRS